MCMYTVAAYLVIMVWHPLLYTIGFIDIFFPMKKKKKIIIQLCLVAG